jgi:hypothetical protein
MRMQTSRTSPAKTVLQKQFLFAALLPELINHALALGFTVSLKELLRTDEQAELYAAQGKGIKNSLHRKSLAIDLVLFRREKPCWDTESYRELGEFWSALHPLCCWGGDFKRRDAFHFSVTHGGVK